MVTVKMEGNYPVCKTCGSLMTKFDNWAWYTCPECGDSVRILDGEVKWHDEIFGRKATYGGRVCEYCGMSLAGGDYTAAWAEDDNPNGYIKCPHCGKVNFEDD